MKKRRFFNDKTRGLRHGIAKLLVPRFYELAVDRYKLSLLRPSLMFIIKNIDAEMVGVEIGVRDAENALSMLENLPVQKLFLVDPYVPYQDGLVYHGEAEQKEHFETARKSLAGFEDKIKFVIKTSEEAIKDVPDGLDFVYIDGNHEYSFVKKDMELYYRKLKIGGVLSGHDYRAWSDVTRAVDEFAKKKGIVVSTRENDWFFRKP